MIRTRRLELNLPLKDFAQRLGIPAATLSRYERGKLRWPVTLYDQARQFLDLPESQPSDFYWSWRRHRAEWDWESCAVEVDPGQTWASLPEGYEDFYQLRKFKNQPGLEIKQLLRGDSSLELVPYAEFYHDGAKTVFASINALNPPYHPIIKESGEALGLARRAAIEYDGWLLWPQVNFLVANRRIRVDLLAYRKGIWVAVESNGPLHAKLSEYDQRRDRRLKIPVERFSEAEIFSGRFTEIFRERMAKYQKKVTPRSRTVRKVVVGASALLQKRQ